MKNQSITSLPASPDEERRHRMREYALMQGIRFLCVLSFFWVRGWWLVVPVIGAIFLPYVAVVLGNAVKSRAGVVQRPGGIVPVAATAGAGGADPAGGRTDRADDRARTTDTGSGDQRPDGEDGGRRDHPTDSTADPNSGGAGGGDGADGADSRR